MRSRDPLDQTTEDDVDLRPWRRGNRESNAEALQDGGVAVDGDVIDEGLAGGHSAPLNGNTAAEQAAVPPGLAPVPEAETIPPHPAPPDPVGTGEATPTVATQRALAFPGPPVIGTGPSFPPFLGPLPRSRAAMSGYAVPDTVLDGAEFPGLTVRGASIRGEDHRAGEAIRQDSMGMWQVADDRTAAILVCTADGVGTEPLSHIGAAQACRELRDLVAPHVSKFFRAASGGTLTDLWEFIVENICLRLNKVAMELQVNPQELSTTLAATLVETDPASQDERRYLILNVGDATGFLLRDGQFLPCLDDPHGEAEAITSTGTYALPTSPGQPGTAVGTMGPRDVLMVCTDGMSNPMRNHEVCDQLAGWWGGDRIPGLPEFGWQLSYRVKSFGDDRTAVCVWGRKQ